MTFPLTPPTVLPLLVCSGDPRGTQKSPGTGDHSDEACQSAKEDGAGVRGAGVLEVLHHVAPISKGVDEVPHVDLLHLILFQICFSSTMPALLTQRQTKT